MSQVKLIAGGVLDRDPTVSPAAQSGFPFRNAFRTGTGTEYRTNTQRNSTEARFEGDLLDADHFYFGGCNRFQRPSEGNAAIAVSSRAIRGAVFDGVNDNLVTTLAVDADGGLTLVAVVTMHRLLGQTILGAWSGAGTRMLFQVGSGGGFFWGIYNGEANWIGRTAPNVYQPNELICFAATYDGSGTTSGLKIFKNGVRVDAGNSTGGSFSAAGAGNALRIGANNNGTAPSAMVGVEWAYYVGELSESEVIEISSTLMNKAGIESAPLGPDYYKPITDYSGLSGWWNCDQSSVASTRKIQQLDDQSGNGNDATQGTDANRPLRTRADKLENYFTHSNDFGNAVWTPQRLTKVGGGFLAPDGTDTAYKIADTTNDATHNLFYLIRTIDNLVPNNFGQYTFSVYARASGHPRVRLDITNQIATNRGGATFDLNSGAISGISAITAEIEADENGFFFCQISGSLLTSDTGIAPHIRLDNGSGVAFAGDGTNTNGIEIWRAVLRSPEGIDYPLFAGDTQEYASPTAQTTLYNPAEAVRNGVCSEIEPASSRYWSIVSLTRWQDRHRWAYISLDKALDLGRLPEPNLRWRTIQEPAGRFKRALREYVASFSAIKHEQAQEAQAWYLRAKRGPVVIYDPEGEFVEGEHVLCRPVRFDAEPQTRNTQRVSIVLREVL